MCVRQVRGLVRMRALFARVQTRATSGRETVRSRCFVMTENPVQNYAAAARRGLWLMARLVGHFASRSPHQKLFRKRRRIGTKATRVPSGRHLEMLGRIDEGATGEVAAHLGLSDKRTRVRVRKKKKINYIMIRQMCHEGTTSLKEVSIGQCPRRFKSCRSRFKRK